MIDSETVKQRQIALEQARASSAIEGQQALPEDAAMLDAWARGEIDEETALRQLLRVEGSGLQRTG